MSKIQPSPEMELLLKCARTRIDEPTAARIRELAGGEIDWPCLREMANNHRVMPLLYRNLYKTCPEVVPADALSQLRQDYQTNAARSLYLTQELLKILDLFKKHGIYAIPFKGPVLAEAVYGDVALRQFDDLDVLVRQIDMLNTKELLLSQGFQPKYVMSSFEERNYLRVDNELMFRGYNGRVNIDLHWRIATRTFDCEIDEESMWGRSRTLLLVGSEVSMLSPADRLLVLCNHGTKHLWGRLGWVCDVAGMVSHGQRLDWGAIYEENRVRGCERMVRLGLLLARDLLGISSRDHAFEGLRDDPALQKLALQVRKQLFCKSHTVPGRFEGIHFRIRARERKVDRLKDAYNLVVVPNILDWKFWRLPPKLSFLYLFLRPIRLANKFIFHPMIKRVE